MAYWGMTHPNTRIAVVAPTHHLVREVCIEGESGLLSLLPPGEVDWNVSKGKLTLSNGTIYQCFSAEEPNKLRGPHHHRAWCDELAAFRYPETWDMLILGLTLGEHPQVVATTTPRPTPLIKELAQRKDVVMSRESTFANEANLSTVALQTLERRYGGTRLGRQELEAQILADIEGALWTWAMVEDFRAPLPTEGSHRTVVAIDPAVTAGEESDETGIIAASYFGPDTPFAKENLVNGEAVGHGFIRADRSGRYSPRGWAQEAVDLFHDLAADRIVAEANQGGDMVRSTLHSIDSSLPITLVTASKGKRTRAEPVSALAEQGRIHHVEPFPELESQLTSWTPGEQSPDRLDALVWAITELMLTGSQDYAFSGMEMAGAVEEPITADMLTRRW